MQKYTLYIIILIVSFSCNGNPKEHRVKHDLKNSNLNAKEKDLEKIASELYANKEYAEAKTYYDELIAIDSTNGEYYFKRGFCKSMSLKDNKGAIADYLLAIKYNYRNKQSAYSNIAVLHRSFALFDSHTDQQRIAEYDTAIYFYNEALKIDPQNAKALTGKQEVQEYLKRLNQ